VLFGRSEGFVNKFDAYSVVPVNRSSEGRSLNASRNRITSNAVAVDASTSTNYRDRRAGISCHCWCRWCIGQSKWTRPTEPVVPERRSSRWDDSRSLGIVTGIAFQRTWDQQREWRHRRSALQRHLPVRRGVLPSVSPLGPEVGSAQLADARHLRATAESSKDDGSWLNSTVPPNTGKVGHCLRPQTQPSNAW